MNIFDFGEFARVASAGGEAPHTPPVKRPTVAPPPGADINNDGAIPPRMEGKAMGIIGFVFLAVGFGWMAEFLWGFRIEGVPYIYPFGDEARYLAGIGLIAAGIIIEALETRRVRRIHRHV